MASFLSVSALAVCLLLCGSTTADTPHLTDADADAYNGGLYGNYPNQTYHSSDIVSPLFLLSAFNESVALDSDDDSSPRYLFIDPDFQGEHGPMIFDARDLSLVYANRSWPAAWDTRVQEVNGSQYLTFWAGSQVIGHGHGHGLFYDETYTLKWNTTARGLETDALMDFHEMQVTEDGTALFVIYEAIPWDLSVIGGPEDGVLLDNIIQEVDLETDEVLWEWRATDHYQVNDSMMPYSTQFEHMLGFDFYHINSVQKYDGNYLISVRHLSAITLLDGQTGDPIWTLGGPFNNFTEHHDSHDPETGRPPRRRRRGATEIMWQHDARFQNANRTRMTLFDNAGLNLTVECSANCSRGLDIEMDYEAMTAKIVEEYYHPVGIVSDNQGGIHRVGGGGRRRVDGGNALIAWGSNPAVTEHTFNGGDLVMSIQTGRLNAGRTGPSMYRAYKMDWVGRPTWDPSIAAAIPAGGGRRNGSDSTDGTTRLYVSWNGATEVRSWALLAGDEVEGLGEGEGEGDDDDSVTAGRSMLGRVDKDGFETEVVVAEGMKRYARFVALDVDGEILGATAVVDCLTGEVKEGVGVVSSIAGGNNGTLGGDSGDDEDDGDGDENGNGNGIGENGGGPRVEILSWAVLAALVFAIFVNA